MVGDVADSDALKIKNLAARKDGRKDLMLFGCRQDEDGVRRRFFKSFEKGIERGLRKHVHLVDDVHFVGSHLGRKANLVDELPNVVNCVVGRGVKLKNIEAVVEALTGVYLVDSTCQNSRTGRLAYPARPGKQQCLSEASANYFVF